MTSVTAAGTTPTISSPRERLQQELQSRVASGTIAGTDETAIETALDAIDEAMKSERASGTRPKPGEIEDRISALIDRQVEEGTLTTDQAEDLKELFASAAPQAGGSPRGPGGPPPGPPPGEGEDAGEASSSTASSDLATLLADFLKQLRDAAGSTTGYGTDGSTTTSGVGALVLDTTA